jgi:membrane protein
MNFGRIWQLLKKTVQEWLDDEASLLAAALAFYTAVSIAPLLVMIVVVAGLFITQSAASDELLSQLTNSVGVQGADFIRNILDNAGDASATSLAGLISLATLLWGSTNVFAQLQNSLNKIWDAPEKAGSGIIGTIKDRLLSFGMVLGIAFLLLVSLVISAILSALPHFLGGDASTWIWQAVNFAVSLAVTTLLFAAIFKVLPDVHIQWRQVWIGALVTALLFTIGKFFLGLYLGNAGSAYGAAGSVMAFLLWVYYSAQIIFFGAEFTQVYANQRDVAGAGFGTQQKEATAAGS